MLLKNIINYKKKKLLMMLLYESISVIFEQFYQQNELPTIKN